MKTRRLLLYLLMLAQIGGLGALYAYRAAGQDAKWRLRFEAGPVDPRDVFRGDYIILSYPGLNGTTSHGDKTPDADGDRYVTLKEAGDFWVMDRVLEAPPAENDLPYLHARRHNRSLEYGLEHYYVPEGKGRPPGKIVVEAAVRPNGDAQIRQVFNDGKPWP